MELIKLDKNLSIYSSVTFFLVIPIGLEELAKHELYEKLDLYFPDLPIPELEMMKGGLLIEWELLHGLMLNNVLKIPTRILLRLDEFKCRDLPRLYKKIQLIPWKFFFAQPTISLSITCHQSRLYHSKRIEKSTLDGIKHFFKGNPPKKRELSNEQYPQTVFIRLDNDLCTVSLDTSGIALYKRGKKSFTTQAPLRENLASALLYEIYRLAHQEEMSLIDPMCGSGTFLFEGATFYHKTERHFAFETWPLLQNAFPHGNAPWLTLHPTFVPQLFSQYIGYDIDPNVVKLAQKNLQEYALGNITIQVKDVLIPSTTTITTSPKVIILNPPYGVRLPPYDQIEDFYHHIFQCLERDFQPELIGIIIPCGFSYRRIIIEHYKLLSKRQFSNGGIKVLFHIFGRFSPSHPTAEVD